MAKNQSQSSWGETDLGSVPPVLGTPADLRDPRESSESTRSPRGETRRAGSTTTTPPSTDREYPRPPTDSKVLVEIISSALEGLSSLASILTKKRLGMNVALEETEAKAIAKPASKMIQRKFNIVSDLNDASDAAGVIANVIKYVERVASGTPPTTPHGSPARAPRPTSFLHSDVVDVEREDYREPSLEPIYQSAADFDDRPQSSKSRETGAGEFKDSLISDFGLE